MTASDNEFSYRDGVTLKEYVDVQLCAVKEQLGSLEKLHNVMVENIEEATTLARVGIERRLEAISEKIDTLSISKAVLEGKASQKSVTIAMVFSSITVLVSIFALVLVLIVK